MQVGHVVAHGIQLVEIISHSDNHTGMNKWVVRNCCNVEYEVSEHLLRALTNRLLPRRKTKTEPCNVWD